VRCVSGSRISKCLTDKGSMKWAVFAAAILCFAGSAVGQAEEQVRRLVCQINEGKPWQLAVYRDRVEEYHSGKLSGLRTTVMTNNNDTLSFVSSSPTSPMSGPLVIVVISKRDLSLMHVVVLERTQKVLEAHGRCWDD
jgi:hypothetical protein